MSVTAVADVFICHLFVWSITLTVFAVVCDQIFFEVYHFFHFQAQCLNFYASMLHI